MLLLGLIVVSIVTGFILYDEKQKSNREEVINRLCNEGQGKYDFCQIKSITYVCKEKTEKK